MHTRKLHHWLAAPLALALAIMACGGGGGGSPEATGTSFPKPTDKPKATATVEAAPEVTATKAPKTTKAPKATATPKAGATQATAPFTLAAEPFAHQSGAFTISVPDGWEVKERDDGVYLPSPDGVASMDISFTNVGVALDETALNAYIDAVEANWFGSFTNY